MNKLINILVVSFVLSLFSVSGQNTFDDYEKKMNERYGKYEKQANDRFNSYRDKANAAFAAYMRKGWKAFEGNASNPIPKTPDPVKQPQVEPNIKPKPESVPFDKIIPIPATPVQPQPIEPIPEIPVKQTDEKFEFDFYNTHFSVRLADSLRFSLPSVTEEAVARIWLKLSKPAYNAFISDCLALRENYKLCDWAYLQLLKKLSVNFMGADNENESTLLQIFVLSQSGYKVRLARSQNNKIRLLLASDYQIYQYPFYTLGGIRYYLIDSNENQLYIFNQEFPNEKQFSLSIASEMLLNQSKTNVKEFSAERFPAVKIQSQTYKEAIDFYNNYPKCDWKVYANTALSNLIKSKAYPVLRQCLADKSEAEGANALINFVQTAFQYQTDDQQFGYERPFFSDELFYYPYSDCEDRSILFSRLVRDLLNLDVVLLHYPNHLATAVKFNENIEGDYLFVNGAKYTVCDPTYIGADIGMAMPQFKEIKADVYTLEIK